MNSSNRRAHVFSFCCCLALLLILALLFNNIMAAFISKRKSAPIPNTTGSPILQFNQTKKIRPMTHMYLSHILWSPYFYRKEKKQKNKSVKIIKNLWVLCIHVWIIFFLIESRAQSQKNMNTMGLSSHWKRKGWALRFIASCAFTCKTGSDGCLMHCRNNCSLYIKM